MIIRPAMLGDEAGIAEVHITAWQVSYRGLIDQSILDGLSIDERTVQWRQRLLEMKPGTERLVLVVKDRIVGFACVAPFREESAEVDHGEVTALYVHPEQQRHGYGTMLLQAAFGWLRRHGYRTVSIQTKEASPFREFYVREGGVLQPDTKMREAMGTTVTLVEYQWSLNG